MWVHVCVCVMCVLCVCVMCVVCYVCVYVCVVCVLCVQLFFSTFHAVLGGFYNIFYGGE